MQHEKASIQLSSCSKCCPLSRMHVFSLRRQCTTDQRPWRRRA